jgi:hypothetical protein
MKYVLFSIALFLCAASGYAQYDKEKLTNILTGRSTKTWMVKSVTAERPEKTFTFNKNMTVAIEKSNKGATVSEQQKWTLTTKDNIRWFVAIGSESYELIVSYAKDGSQFLKFTHQAGVSNVSGSFEMILYPSK